MISIDKWLKGIVRIKNTLERKTRFIVDIQETIHYCQTVFINNAQSDGAHIFRANLRQISGLSIIERSKENSVKRKQEMRLKGG